MTENAVSQQEALELIAGVINESIDDVQPGVALESLEGWDSMAVLLLMAEFDERFDIVLDEKRIESLHSVDDILAVLRENGSLG
jgi:acyl carrier protein